MHTCVFVCVLCVRACVRVCLNRVHRTLTLTTTSTAFDIDTLRVLTLITSSTDWIQPCKQQVKMTTTSQQPQCEVSTDQPKSIKQFGLQDADKTNSTRSLDLILLGYQCFTWISKVIMIFIVTQKSHSVLGEGIPPWDSETR